MRELNFADRLVAAIRSKQSYVVVGLDPQLEYIPRHLLDAVCRKGRSPCQIVAQSFLSFNCAIVDAVAPHVVAVKPQLAFYERYGWAGIRVFTETVRYAQQRGLLVIADAKRSDIGSTAAAYADAFLGQASVERGTRPVFDVDAITVNPYLGADGIMPFIKEAKRYGKGVFVLVRTSNPSARDLQDLETPAGLLYRVVGNQVWELGMDTEGVAGYRAVGAVVGATYPEEATELRRLMPRCFFLVPGYGAQGATARDTVPCFNTDGLGAVINAARSIICAYTDPQWSRMYAQNEFAAAAAAAAAKMKDDLNREVSGSMCLPWNHV